MKSVSAVRLRQQLLTSLIATAAMAVTVTFARGSQQPLELSDRQADVSVSGWRASSLRPVVLRGKTTMARQPRPASAPIRHLDQRADSAVKLLGIESLRD